MIPVIRIFGYKFTIKDFLIIFFCYFLFEPIFSWFFIPDAVIVDKYEQLLSIGIFCFVIFNFQQLEKYERIYVSIFTFLILKLVLESLALFGSIFEYFYLYMVIFPVVYTIFIKLLFKKLDIDILEFLCRFYLCAYVVFMIWYGRGFSFSLEGTEIDLRNGPFAGDSRIIHARSIFMIILPFLWYLNKFIRTQSKESLFWILFCFIIILIHQHRSVWSSAIFAVLYYFLILARNEGEYKLSIFKFCFIALAVFVIGVGVVSTFKPDLLTFFADRFSEILEPNKEGSTGSFRVLQREVYFDLYLKRPLFGWSFDGYELPNPIVDWWPENTGQHFHEGFIEILFYHGIVGLVLKYSLLFYLLIKSLKDKISEKSMVLTSFCLCGLIFSLAYVPSLIFWGHVGVCLYYVEKDKDEEENRALITGAT